MASDDDAGDTVFYVSRRSPDATPQDVWEFTLGGTRTDHACRVRDAGGQSYTVEGERVFPTRLDAYRVLRDDALRHLREAKSNAARWEQIVSGLEAALGVQSSDAFMEVS